MAKDVEVNFWSGNEACAEGAAAVGCTFFAGYPVSPSTDIARRMAKRMPEAGGVFLQMEDEIASLCACLGASWAGAKSMTAASGPGFSHMLEGIGFGIMTETPVVIVNVQCAGPAMGQATRPAQGDVQQARWGAHGDYQIIAVSPSSVQEMYDLTIEAFNLSEKFRVPVIILADEAIGRLRENVSTKKKFAIINRSKRLNVPPFGAGNPATIAPMPPLGSGQNLLVTGSTHDEYGFRKATDAHAHAKLLDRLQSKISSNTKEIIKTEYTFAKDADTLLISYGASARSCVAAANLAAERGYKVGFLRLITLWPFPDEIVARAASASKKVIVVEMNKGQIAREVVRASKSDVECISRTDGELIMPDEILNKII